MIDRDLNRQGVWCLRCFSSVPSVNLVEVVNMGIDETVDRVLKIYRIADRDIHRFRSRSGLQCLRFCSHCCSNINVSATELELLPLAFWLYQRQRAQHWLEKLNEIPVIGHSKCVLLQFPKHGRNIGRCAAYKMRPLICRLFGFSAVLDKHNRPQLVTCGVIKKLYNQTYVETARSLGKYHVPIMKKYYTLLYALDFARARRFYTINEALKMAIETVLSHFTYRQKGDG